METPYGKPSGPVVLGKLSGKPIAFIPRHGPEHTILPHKVPYKANLAALKMLGVDQVFATCVVGSLKEEVVPGSFVVPNQFINFTWGRDDTADIDKDVIHLPMANPYCENMRKIAIEELKTKDVYLHEEGTIVVIQGPRFSTIAEGKMFSLLGGDIVNMTQYPECYFARELGICYAVIASVTDYDGSVPVPSFWMNPDSMEEVLKVFKKNTELTKNFLETLLLSYDKITACSCAKKRVDEYYKMANKDSP